MIDTRNSASKHPQRPIHDSLLLSPPVPAPISPEHASPVKFQRKSLKVQPIVTPRRVSSLQVSPHTITQPADPILAPPVTVNHQLSEKQPHVSDSPGGGPEISRKLRELITSQTKRYEAFVKSQQLQSTGNVPEPPVPAPTIRIEPKSTASAEGENSVMSKLCENGLITVIEEQNDDDEAENSIIYEDATLNRTPSSSIMIKRRRNAAGGGVASLKSSLTTYLSGTTSKGLNCISSIVNLPLCSNGGHNQGAEPS